MKHARTSSDVLFEETKRNLIDQQKLAKYLLVDKSYLAPSVVLNQIIHDMAVEVQALTEHAESGSDLEQAGRLNITLGFALEFFRDLIQAERNVLNTVKSWTKHYNEDIQCVSQKILDRCMPDT